MTDLTRWRTRSRIHGGEKFGFILPDAVTRDESLASLRRETIERCARCGPHSSLQDGVVDPTCECTHLYRLLDGLTITGIPRSYWGYHRDNFSGSQQALEECASYVEHLDEAVQHGQGLLLVGPYGTGKSTLASLVGIEAFRAGYSVYYTPVVSFIEDVIQSHRSGRIAEKLRVMAERTDLLILDDLGAEAGAATKGLEAKFVVGLGAFLRNRLGGQRPTLFTTNLKMDGKGSIEEFYGRGVAQIIAERSFPIAVAGKALRDAQIKRMQNISAVLTNISTARAADTYGHILDGTILARRGPEGDAVARVEASE